MNATGGGTIEPNIGANLYFESNIGQVDPQVRFIGADQGYKLYLMDNEVRMAMYAAGESSTIGLQFPNANANPDITAAVPLGGMSHYYRGSDPAQWVENVAHFGEVLYHELYPGIDLLFHSRNGYPEYDFIVNPGIDPSTIRLAIQGADTMEIDDAGRLALGFSNGRTVVMQSPVIYQESKAQLIDGRYQLLEDHTVMFELGEYDRSKTLIIDPELVFSTYVGGQGIDWVSQGRGADETGTYTCMQSDADAIPGYGVIQDPATTDESDVVCIKHGPTGEVVYATLIGGQESASGPSQECPGCDYVLDFVSDHQGNVHVAGGTTSTDFPILNGFQTALLGAGDGFVSSLGPNGALTFSSYLGGDEGSGMINEERGHAISAGPDGSLYIGGTTASPNFLASTGAAIHRLTTPQQGFDNFAIKLNPDHSLAFVSVWGGDDFEQVFSIVADSQGVIYLNGFTRSSNYPVSAGAFQPQQKGSASGFVTKLNATGDQMLYSSYIGGSNFDWIFEGGALDASGNFVFVGITDSPDFPVTENAFQGVYGGDDDAFIVVFKPDGNGADDLVYSSFLGGSDYEDAINSVVDRHGNIYLTGETDSTDFPVTPDAFQSELKGVADAYLTVLNPSLPPSEQLLYSTYIGGEQGDFLAGPGYTGIDFGSGLGQDGQGNVYIHGLTEAPDFPVSDGVAVGQFAAIQPDFNLLLDNFVTKFHIWDEVEIDIKPGNEQNRVNLKSNGVLPIAILSSASLDAPAEVDAASIRLAGAPVKIKGNGKAQCENRDVNRDGTDDLECKIETGQLNLDQNAAVANLIARTHNGDIIMGQDAISVVP